jgi:hypothetical protein
MLPNFRRFIAVNNTGSTNVYDDGGRLNLKQTAYKYDPDDGGITETILSDDDLGFGAGDSTADGSEDKSSEIDNTTDEYVGVLVQLEVTHSAGAAAEGWYDLYMDGGDATGELASDATGYDDAETNELQFIGSLRWHSAASDDEVMRSKVFKIE